MLRSMKLIVTATSTLGMIVGALSDHGNQATALSMVPNPHGQQRVLLDHPVDGSASRIEDDKAGAPKEILLSIDNGLSTVPADQGIHDTSLDVWFLGQALDLAKTKAVELHLDQVATDIETWVKAHPYKATFYLASALSLVAPEIISLPALEALGFGFAGVRAGSMAAKIQSVIGDVAARSVFAIWQSARMGGYGVEYVNGGVRALVALADAAVAKCNPLKDCKGLRGGGGGGEPSGNEGGYLGDGLKMKVLGAVVGGWVGAMGNMLW
ncbi:MAG: hypothetical protein Q9169_007400 [Polycauliona sp. 2 TL-2023]